MMARERCPIRRRTVGRSNGRSVVGGRSPSRRVGATGKVLPRVARFGDDGARARGEARTSECERTNRDPTVMSHQDWKEITIGKRPQSGGGGGSMKAAKDPKAVAAALRAGAAVSTMRKDSGAGRNALKLELDDENLTHKTVSVDVKKAILQGRLAKKLTQAQLAQQINEKPQIVQEYESGKAIPNQQILGKLERVLGVKLRGKGVGKK